MTPRIVRTLDELRSVTSAWRLAKQTHALVPTMGALHEGHLALVRLARQHAKRVVVSIFVNPAQFGPAEDLARYPRDEAGDAAKLATVDCDLIWLPDAAEMYPPGFATRIVPEGAARGLETDFRPEFFAGVATVCCKLFTQVAPMAAIFGEKDYQQLCVVRQLVRDLNLPLDIIGAPTIREPDGLAMSSRNRYLTPQERLIAPVLHRQLTQAATSIEAGHRMSIACARARDALGKAGFRVDYLTLRDATTLAPIDNLTGQPLRLLATAWLDKTRLIDNIAVLPPQCT